MTRDGAWKIRDLLLRNRPHGVMSPNVASAFWYHGAKLPKMRHSEIIYFAAIVFWRGCAHDWSQVDASLSRLEFPQELEAEFRASLLGRAVFPSSVVLHVEVASQRPDGSWVNPENLVKEDDPLIATAFAIRALAL